MTAPTSPKTRITMNAAERAAYHQELADKHRRKAWIAREENVDVQEALALARKCGSLAELTHYESMKGELLRARDGLLTICDAIVTAGVRQG